MSRLANRFAELRAAGTTALVPFITAGDPNPGATVKIMHALVAAGANVIELGVPFSDPMADGPTIQAACERALAHGTSLRDVLAMVREFRQQDTATPVVLMGYLNPIDRMGVSAFAEQARAAGVDGVLPVDLSAEEAPDVLPALTATGLDAICLIAPTTSTERMVRICAHSSGFVYYVSFKGVTGAGGIDVAELTQHVNAVREHTDLPVAVGFGVRTPAIAAAVAQVADAVVVGSALVSVIGERADDEAGMLAAVADKLAAMRAAMDKQTIAGENDA